MRKLLSISTILVLAALSAPSSFALGSDGSASCAPGTTSVVSTDTSTTGPDELPKVTCETEIAAPANIVWKAIKARRVSDLSRRQLLSYDGKTAVVKELFGSMPIIGVTTCTYAENEICPGKQLEYKLLNSNHLRAFEGRWRLEPGPQQNTTLVFLSSTIDPGIRVPFWRRIVRTAIENDVKASLREVSNLAGKL